jgi:hypothetical protein
MLYELRCSETAEFAKIVVGFQESRNLHLASRRGRKCWKEREAIFLLHSLTLLLTPPQTLQSNVFMNEFYVYRPGPQENRKFHSQKRHQNDNEGG